MSHFIFFDSRNFITKRSGSLAYNVSSVYAVKWANTKLTTKD